MAQPNILLISSDQQHYFTLGLNNPDIQTPNLDRLAAMGVNFSRAYCPNPTCTPTRASMLTGQYPSTHGAWALGTKLADDAPTISGLLSEAGYDTSLIGKAHFQQLKPTDQYPSVESNPILRDLDFWRTFNDLHTPWYGFDHVELVRNHSDEGLVGQHYGLWLEEQGLSDWRAYFQKRTDGVSETEHEATKAPTTEPNSVHGWRDGQPWQLPEHLHYTTWTGRRTIAAIERSVQAGNPFFVWSSYPDPHPPYAVPEPWHSMYDPADMKIGRLTDNELQAMPPPHQLTREDQPDYASLLGDEYDIIGYHRHINDPDQLRQAQAIYYGMISFMDHWIGQTLDALQRLGQLDDTLIVFTSDHGHYLGQHGLVAKGAFHYEDGIRVPLIAAWGDRLPHAMENQDIQSLVDLAPSFAEAAGLEVPVWMQGVSQVDAWSGRAQSPRDWAIVEHHFEGQAVHLRTLVSERYKLTVYRGRPAWGELFDLEADPRELHNRYDDPTYAPVVHDMMSRLVQADLEREFTAMPRVANA